MITTTPHWTPSWPMNERKNWCRILSRHRHHKAQGKMGRFEKFGHYRTFTCGILVSWKTAGARAKPQPNSERPPGHENLAAFLFPYHGPGHRTAGAFLLSPCPRRIVHERGGLAQTSLSPGSSMPRVAQGLPCGFTAPSPLWVLPGKRRIAGQVKSDYFSQKMRKKQGCFVTLF